MSIPVTMVRVKTLDSGTAVYFSAQEKSNEGWVGTVAEYKTSVFPAGSCFISANILERFPNKQIADEFIAGQHAIFEKAGKLCLNTNTKDRPKLKLTKV